MRQAISAAEWWGSRRLRYNVGLVVAGLFAFVCYIAVELWGISIGAIRDADGSNLLTVIVQGMGYLVMMVVANVCYSLGALSERLVKPVQLENYRRITFGLGFWFSVLLPFSIPMMLLALCIFRPVWWDG
jgi:hypothetical protein